MSAPLRRIRMVVGLAVKANRRLAVVSATLLLAEVAVLTLIALGLRATIDSALAGNAARATLAGFAVAALWVSLWPLKTNAFRRSSDLADLTFILVNEQAIELVNGTPGMEHLERPQYANRLETFRNSVHGLWFGYQGAVQVVAAALQLIVLLTILALIEPALAILPLFAVPALVIGRNGERRLERARDVVAEDQRLSRHLLDLATQADSGKELRVFGLQSELRRRYQTTLDRARTTLERAEHYAAFGKTVGQLIFAVGYGSALYLVITRAIEGTRSIGDVLLTVALASQISAQLSTAQIAAARLQAAMNAVARFDWLKRQVHDVPGFDDEDGQAEAPDRIVGGITLRGVSFAYPEAEHASLSDIDLVIPAGAVVALVGENGAGKSTLVKLLARLYEPTAGEIRVDDIALQRIELETWRKRLTGAFQDFLQIEATLRESVGVGDLALVSSREAVTAAIDRAHANDLPTSLHEGLETSLGRSYANGQELSGGQWQKVAIGRGMMRTAPLLLLLDEPTSALDANAEHALFNAYAARARSTSESNGAITILVSHRFSTVQTADLIVVMDKGRIKETGTHDELLARNETYAELYKLQAAGYR